MPVFPCRADKKPVCPHGFHDASADPSQIRELFSAYTGILIGVPTGDQSGFSVIDVDPQGMPWLSRIMAKKRLPATRVHKTPRGGYHFLYTNPIPSIRNSSSKIAAGIDIRGEGGYVIFPPSKGYIVVDESPISPFPIWIIKQLNKQTSKSSEYKSSGIFNIDALERFIISSKPGQRNNRIFWAACRAGELGLNRDSSNALISAACSTGIDRIEAQKTVASGLFAGRRDAQK